MDLNPLNQINVPVIGSIAAIFLGTYAVMRKVYFLPYIKAMEAREERLAEARRKHAEADVMWGDSETAAAEAVASGREQSEQIVREGHERAARERKAILEEAMREVSELLDRGRADIAEARDNELATLRQQAADCVGLACDKLVGGVDPITVETAVDKLLAKRVQ